MKKIICVLLVLFLLSGMLVACNTNDKEESSSDESTEETGFHLEKKYWDTTITFATHNLGNFSTAEIAPTEITEEPVNDAFYERAQYMKETYGLNIEVVYFDTLNGAAKQVQDNITADVDDIQVLCSPILYSSQLGVAGDLYDLNELNDTYGYLDLEAEYWDRKAINDLTIAGSLYFVTGDIIVSDDESTWCVLFNKDLVEEYSLDNPYDLVNDNEWNIDKMYQLAKQTTTKNGDTLDFTAETDDVFGLITQTYDCFAMMLSCEQPMVTNDGERIYLTGNSEKTIDVFTNIFNMMIDSDYVAVADFYGNYTQSYTWEKQIFANGKALFMPYSISVVSDSIIREADIHYGILPMPKADENQENYSSSSTVYWSSFMSIPISNDEKLEATVYCLEAMAYYGYEHCTEEYYERTLKYKRFEDDESMDMLDLIFRNRTYDLGAIFNFGDTGKGDGMLYFYTSLLGSKNNTFASSFEAKYDTFQASIDDLMEQVNK